MALLDDVFKGGNLVTALALGVGVVIVAPLAMSLLRPVAKTIIKAGLVAYDEGSRAIAQLSTATADMVNEAKTEVLHEYAKSSHVPHFSPG